MEIRTSLWISSSIRLLRPNPTFVSYFGTIKSIDDPGIFLYQTYTVTSAI